MNHVTLSDDKRLSINGVEIPGLHGIEIGQRGIVTFEIKVASFNGAVPCPACHGEGRMIIDWPHDRSNCKHCAGKGWSR